MFIMVPKQRALGYPFRISSKPRLGHNATCEARAIHSHSVTSSEQMLQLPHLLLRFSIFGRDIGQPLLLMTHLLKHMQSCLVGNLSSTVVSVSASLEALTFSCAKVYPKDGKSLKGSLSFIHISLACPRSCSRSCVHPLDPAPINRNMLQIYAAFPHIKHTENVDSDVA